MQYRRLGRSGMKVSAVALGTWLTYGHSVPDATARACLEAAFDAGINFIDTADVYALGACESALGAVLEGRPRKDYVLASKVFFPTGPGPNDTGLSRKHVHESLDASLRRLRTDYLDLYQCHRHDPETPVSEVVRTMDALVRRGKILYWGVSMWPAARIAEAVRIAEDVGAEPPVSNQPCYNMLQRTIELEVLPLSDELGVGQVVYSPLAQGLLTGKYAGGKVPPGSRAADERSNQFIRPLMNDENMGRVEAIGRIADRAGIPLARLALAWCLRHPGVNAVIVGASRPEQVTENAAAADLDLSADLVRELETVLGDE